MRTLTLLLAAAAIFVARSASYEEEDDVLVLTESNFQDAINEFDPLLVEFYAPWCGHCKALKEPYAAAAKTLKAQNLRLAKVDATEHRGLAEQFEVKGFPTLKFFKNGSPSEYSGGRTEDTIVNWVLKKSGPAARTLQNLEEIANFVGTQEVAVVGHFKDLKSKEASAFMTVASDNEDLQFAVVEDSVNKVVVHRTFDGGEPVEITTALKNAASLGKTISRESLPLVVPFTGATSNRIFGGDIQVHFLMFGNPETDADAFAGFTEAASEQKMTTLFITVPESESRIREYFNLKQEEMPTAILADMRQGDMKKFRLSRGANGEHDWTAAGLNSFIESFFKGELKPFLKSEPIPAEGDDMDGHVKVVVGKSFEQVVLDSEKDVLLEFYAPWCGHCKNLAPEYEKAAATLASNSNVLLAKIDATANEVDFPGVSVRGFPTLYFFPAGASKQATIYDGPRTADGIVSWISENAETEVTIDDVAEDEL
jgi:protein disulfide-isomerase A1